MDFASTLKAPCRFISSEMKLSTQNPLVIRELALTSITSPYTYAYKKLSVTLSLSTTEILIKQKYFELYVLDGKLL